MLKKPKNKQKTVAEKVAETLLHQNHSGSDSDSGDEATATRIVEYDEEEYELPQIGTTEFRKRNVKLLSEQSAKYIGKIASRKDFESEEDDLNSDSDEESESEEEVDYENSDTSENDKALKSVSIALKTKKTVKEQQGEYEDSEEDVDEESQTEEELDYENSDSSDNDKALESFSRALKTKKTAKERADYEDSEEDADGEEQNVDSDESDDGNYEDDSCNEDGEDEETEVINQVNHEAEIQKGLCVQSQLRIWERLLELRINLQKLLNKTNQLSAPEDLKDLKENNTKFKEVQQTACKQTSQLLQNLLTLKSSLCTQFSELDTAIKPSLKRASPFKEQNSEEPPLKQIGEYLQQGFENFQPYRNSVLLKWDDRTKLLQPGAGTKKKTLNEEYDIIKKIDSALMNKTILKEKSQHLKSSSQLEGKHLETPEENVRNPNIYDDSDFYHQQLRELIEYKANTSSNMSEVTKQFLELQKLRQKMKKKVDTRASKGRKLRYIVHNKLINFMAPHDNSTWNLESVDELSKSLFV